MKYELVDKLIVLLNCYQNDELTLRDLVYLDEEFNDLLDSLMAFKEDIVYERFNDLAVF